MQRSKRGQAGHHRHPALWATLTLIAFPAVALSLDALGADPFRSFLSGALASLIVLLLEAVVRKRWWISDPAITTVLDDPNFGWRLLCVTGILVLVFQTLILTGFLTSASLDQNIIRFVLNRHCAAPSNGFIARLCDAAATPTKADAATMALREAAERRFFPGGFVTCAVRSQGLIRSSETFTQISAIRCDRWMIGTITRLPSPVEYVERSVLSRVRVLGDGTYRVENWSEDPTSAEWGAIGGDAASGTAEWCTNMLKTEREQMRAETFRRALERVRR